MKPTKMRNQMIYQATHKTKSKQLGSALSKDLRKKYGKRSARVIEGDSVTILRGEFKGVDGKVASVSTQKNSVAMEGVKKEKTKGDKFDVYIHTSNLVVTSLNTEDKWRIAKLEGKDPRKQVKIDKVKTETEADSTEEAHKEIADEPKEIAEKPKETIVEDSKKEEDEN